MQQNMLSNRAFLFGKQRVYFRCNLYHARCRKMDVLPSDKFGIAISILIFQLTRRFSVDKRVKSPLEEGMCLRCYFQTGRALP